jgi:hypothetical protein
MSMMHPLINTLVSEGPSPSRAEKLALYGQFVGSWEFDAEHTPENGAVLSGKGEIRFDYVLGGRAIQDVWILPARNAGPSPSLGGWAFFGTTLRVYDPGKDAWHIFWIDPLGQAYSRQLGRASANGITQIGTDDTGSSVRWSFSDITPASFTWTGERSNDGGATWRHEVRFLARRVTTKDYLTAS